MGYCNFATVVYKLRFFIMIERVNAPTLGAGGLTLLKYTNKKKLVQTVSAQNYLLYLFRRGSGIRTHDPLLPKQVR